MPDAQKTRTLRLCLVTGFAALLLAPCLLWGLLRPYMDTQNHENRTLAAFPDADTPLPEWPAAFEEWLGDHAPFRNECLTLKAGADRLLGTLDSSDVLRGRDGWLFLKDVGDSKSLSDYQGLTAYTPEEMTQLTDALNALRGTLAAHGARLAVLFAPAKEGVYCDKLPASLPAVSRPTRVQALAEHLRQSTDIPVVFPLDELQAAARQQQVYYKYDTHWNDVGAWLAAQLTLAALGRPAGREWPAVAARADLAAPTDLANMCGSWAYCTDDVYYEVDAPRAAGSDGPNAELLTYSGSGDGTLLLLRDSFGASLAPHLANGFAQALVVHGNALSPANLDARLPALPDAVVLEVGERFSDNLFRTVQVLQQWADALPAPGA